MGKNWRSLVFSPQRRLGGDLITVFQYLKGSYKEDRGSPFPSSHMERTRHNRYKLHWKRFHLDIIFLQEEPSFTG